MVFPLQSYGRHVIGLQPGYGRPGCKLEGPLSRLDVGSSGAILVHTFSSFDPELTTTFIRLFFTRGLGQREYGSVQSICQNWKNLLLGKQ